MTRKTGKHKHTLSLIDRYRFSPVEKCTMLLLLLIDMRSFVARRLLVMNFMLPLLPFLPQLPCLFFCCASSSLSSQCNSIANYALGASMRVCKMTNEIKTDRLLTLSLSFSSLFRECRSRRRSLFRQIEHVIDFTPVKWLFFLFTKQKRSCKRIFFSFSLLLNCRNTPISLT